MTTKIILDRPSFIAEESVFRQHQHDETLLGITYHHQPKGVMVLPAEDFPFLSWHHRKPEHEYRTLLPRMQKHINGIEQQFLNSAAMSKMRKFFLEKYFINHFKSKEPRKKQP